MADGSRDYSLPTIQGKHSDLKTISPETVLKCFIELLFPAESGYTANVLKFRERVVCLPCLLFWQAFKQVSFSPEK